MPELRFPEFSGEWAEKRLGEICDTLSGSPVAGDEIIEQATSVPLLRGVNITEGIIRHSTDIDRYHGGDVTGLDRFLLEEGDVVIGMDGSKVGKNSAIISERDAGSFLIQRVSRLRSNGSGSVDYIYHQVRSDRFIRYVDTVNTSSGIPHISLKQIRDFPVPWADPVEQKKIAGFLSAVDRRIEGLEKRRELLKEYKKGLMQKLFNQSLRFKDDHGNPFPDWEEKRLGEVGEFANGINKDKDSFGKGVPFVNLQDIFGIQVLRNAPLGLVDASAAEVKRYSLKKGDVLFVRSSVKPEGVGLTSVVANDFENTVYTGILIRLRAQEGRFDLLFSAYCFHTTDFRKSVLAKSSVSANTNINQESLKKITVQFPCLEEQRKIADCLSAVDRKIEQIEKQVAQTRTFKQGLLQKMFVQGGSAARF